MGIRSRAVADLLGMVMLCGAGATHATVEADGHWWLRGESRARIESLDGQFRTGGSGSDQQLALRNLLWVEWRPGPLALGFELQDSRGYLDDRGSPLTTSLINAADVLQAYARREFGGDREGAATHRWIVGRQTLDIGSRRQVERVEFANVIFNYTGAYWRRLAGNGSEWHAFAVVPVDRRPGDLDALIANRRASDQEAWQRRYWAVHWIGKDAFVHGMQVEAYVYGLREDDTRNVPTPNRDYLTPGLRLFRSPSVGVLDFDLESAWRHGSRRAGSAATDLRDLDVRARTVHAHLGWTFAHPWRPRIALDYDYASGDRDPNDNRFDQYERLFGSRRTDLGHTGIFGPLTPANLDAPGARIEFQPGSRSDARIAWKHARLASTRDAWVIAGVRDRSGAAGRTIGNTFDARMRHWLVADRLRLEIGAAYLRLGRFARDAPNASGQGNPRYGYMQLTLNY